MRKKKTAHIKDVLKAVFKGLDQTKKEGERLDKLMACWEEAAGEQACKHTKIAALKKGVLVVNVDSTVWIYQLRLKEKQILNSLNRCLKKANIKGIRFRAGEI